MYIPQMYFILDKHTHTHIHMCEYIIIESPASIDTIFLVWPSVDHPSSENLKKSAHSRFRRRLSRQRKSPK